MEQTVSDIFISGEISADIRNDYATGIEFITANPDYSLLKFRDIVNAIADILARKFSVEFASEKIHDKINELSTLQIISYPLREQLHKVRKLGNTGVHKTGSASAEAEFLQQRFENLVRSAHEARRDIVSIFEDVYHILKDKHIGVTIELCETKQQAQREILHKASTEVCHKAKLKAGIVCEGILKRQSFDQGLIAAESVAAHLQNLYMNAVSFYDAACAISADIDKHLFEFHEISADSESIILKYGDLEALCRYAELAIDEAVDTDLHKKGCKRAKAAADRGYLHAKSLYGEVLFDKGECKKALTYLSAGEKEDDTRALRGLFLIYTEGHGCDVDAEKGLAYLQRAVELDCPDAIASLGEAHHKGVLVEKDDLLARELLLKSIDMGSVHGKRYYMIEFNDLAGQINEQFKHLAEELARFEDQYKPEPYVALPKIGRNEPCFCGSGKKYKRCCLNDDSWAAEKPTAFGFADLDSN